MNLAYEGIERAIGVLEASHPGRHISDIVEEALAHLYNAQTLLMQEKTCTCGPREGCSDCP